MRMLKKGNNNNNKKRLAYTALVRPILEYGAVCWDHTEKVRQVWSGVLGPYKEGQVSMERCVGTIQRRSGEYGAVCWDHTKKVR